MMSKTDRIQVCLDPGLYRNIKRLSEETGFSISEIGLLAIREGIDTVLSQLYPLKRPVATQAAQSQGQTVIQPVTA